MAADTMGGDAREALARLGDHDAVCRGQLGGAGAHDGLGEARDGVRGRAALDSDDARARRLARDRSRADGGAIEALLAAAHRELGVGREEEVGLGIVGEVVLDVAHVGLLVGAEDHAQGVGQRLSRDLDLLGKEAAGVERQHRGALVVGDAAAKQPAVTADHLVGVGVPARALGHDVNVGNRGDLLGRGTGNVGKAEVALAVVGLEAADVGDAEGLVERLARARAPGGALGGLREVLDALVRDERLDVVEHLGPHAVDELVDLGLELGIGIGHGNSRHLRARTRSFPHYIIRPNGSRAKSCGRVRHIG